MRALTSRLISRNLLAFGPSSPSRLFLSPFLAGFPAMAERASLCVSSDDAARPLSQSIQNRASDFADSESLSHELQHSDHDQSNNSPLREQGGCTEAEAASTSERNGHQCKGEDGKVAVKFQLKNSCVLALQRGDITKWSVDGKTDGIVSSRYPLLYMRRFKVTCVPVRVGFKLELLALWLLRVDICILCCSRFLPT